MDAQQEAVRKKKIRHSQDWIDSLVKLVTIDGMSAYDVAEQAGVAPSQVYRWVNKHKIREARKDSSSEAAIVAELRDVRRENEYLKKQVEFLKKAATYFASQSSSDSLSSESITGSTK